MTEHEFALAANDWGFKKFITKRHANKWVAEDTFTVEAKLVKANIIAQQEKSQQA